MRRLLQNVLRTWFDLPLISKGMIIISIPLVCVLFSAIAIKVFQQQREHLTEWIDRAFQAGQRMQSVISLLADAESGCRAFLLTHDEKQLEPLYKAERELPKRLDRLRAALRDSNSQMKRVERISDLSHQRLAALRALLAETQPQLLAERIAQGQALSGAIKQEFGGIAGEESNRWILRIVAETGLRKRISVAVYGGTILSLLAGGFSMALFLTGIVRRSQMLRENADRLARGELLVELAPSADEIGRLGDALARSSHLLAAREGELRKLNYELDLRVQERTSQLERANAERRRSEEQLGHAQKMEAIGRLAGGVAHDFNNALTLILGFGELLGEQLPPNASGEYLEQIFRSAEHAASLTRQLLAFSRRQMIQSKLVDLNVVVSRMEKLLRHLIGEDILLRTQIAERLENILADEGQMEQVIMNLAVNARDAMPKGGNLSIRTELVELDETFCQRHLPTVPGRYVMLAVSDSGHGMTEEVQSRIFEPFFTTKERGKGTGLGLSIVYGIVEQSGGTIWVYSEPGVGTTFKVYLPVPDRTEERIREIVALDASIKSSATILLVEDDPAVRQMTSRILVRNGYTVLEAQDAETARSLCSSHPGKIELLLTDVIMPKVNGFELSQELQRAYPALKVLYMSGYTDDALTRHAGVLDKKIDFIEKPFTPKNLCAKIRDVLGRHEQPSPVTVRV